MAGNDGQAESKQQPGTAVDESQQLQSRVDKLREDMYNEVVDGNVAGRDDLAEICKVLKDISDKMTAGKQEEQGQQELLPQSKREELEKLLPLIERAFQRRRSSPPPSQEEDEAAADKKKKLLLLPSCNPFINKARSSSASKQHKEEEQEEDEGVSVKLLLRLAQNVLEPEQYYEWTTSYVDESRIYGWDKEADAVVDALIAPGHPTEDDDSLLFRAAGIAGVHGSGKTALAQKVFVHDRAKDNFALRLWLCVGPPDSEDRFCLLYRMLDNLGLDTYKVEDIVDNSNAVKETVARIRADPARVAAIQKKAADYMTTHAQELQHKTPDSIFDQLLREEADVESSKIGVLLYILHMTLSKTSYMIVFDDIREYGDDGWYRNLAQLPPPDGEWGARLGYGLPKGSQHRGAVLLTCRNEEHARNMVRTGRVFRPPKLELDDAWKLFKREYDQAKDAIGNKKKGEDDDDMLFKELEQMKVQIVGKCLGLPVAIAEAAKGFAALDPLPDDDGDDANKTPDAPAAKDQTTPAGAAASSKSNTDMQQPAATTTDVDDGPRPS
ncbi:hypothetical protein HU200_037392 [Digitaria exilis]|uniref:NB-ARC domain-containing protein n=1 Tax=Digitaria exilis TaxID=1010633 RepID=A0A835BK83_9POAL|nr:hypothetical protein HU200_037392 [Digitaria exilis]CAB3455437.1 unnamed protein product [Digitaria exilis]